MPGLARRDPHRQAADARNRSQAQAILDEFAKSLRLMASLKAFRNRIARVKATRKITKAQQMVAASQIAPRAGRRECRASLLRKNGCGDRQPCRWHEGQSQRAEIACRARASDHDASADRGDRRPRPVRRLQHQHRAAAPSRQIEALLADGKKVKILCVGRKGRDQLKRLLRPDDRRYRRVHRRQAHRLRQCAGDRQARAARCIEEGAFDVATIIYSRFKSVMTRSRRRSA